MKKRDVYTNQGISEKQIIQIDFESIQNCCKEECR